MLALAAAHAAAATQNSPRGRQEVQPGAAQQKNYALSSVKTDSSALMEWKRKRENHNQQKMLRPQLSKIAITSLEFSEALPLAAFASLLVETVAKLDHVIEEVEELGTMACFKEYDANNVSVTCTETPRIDVVQNQLPCHGTD